MKAIILDVDTGIDDALAIGYAVRSPELNVLGVTTCFGNISVEEATRNTLIVLEHLGSDIPVIPGAGKPFVREPLKEYAKHVHGNDGLANTVKNEPARNPADDYAPSFIVRQVKKRPKQVTFISVGTLTNLALAIRQAPEIVELIGEVVIMGGAVTVPGNSTPHAEANIYADPDAAEYVFRSGIPIVLVGLDVTMKTLLPLEKSQRWRDLDTPYANFMADITEFYIAAYEGFTPGIGGCALHDPLAVGVAIDSTFVKMVPMHVEVDLEGIHSLGRTVADLSNNAKAAPNMRVCLEVDAERFVSHFMSRIV